MASKSAVKAVAAAALVLLGTALLASPPRPVVAHSVLWSPKPNNRADCTDIRGRRLKCNGKGNTACPDTWKPNEWGHSWKRPAATYRRGQHVTFYYHKNNHGPAGFTRWSLVPAAKWRSVKAHQRFAFWWNCWGSGFHTCRKGTCGSDRRKKAWATKVIIPTSIPDGNYVLGFGTLGAIARWREWCRWPICCEKSILLPYLCCSVMKLF